MPIISVDARTTALTSGAASLTKAHTCAANASLLIASFVFGQSATETNFAVTYNGVAMVEAYHSAGEFWDTYIYYLLAPASGAHNIAATWTNSNRCYSQNISLIGTDKVSVSPIRDTDGGEFLSGDPQTKTLTSTALDYVFSACAGQAVCDSSAPLTDFGDQNDGAGYSTGADGAAAGLTVDVTWHNTGSNRFGFGAVTIKPAGGGQVI